MGFPINIDESVKRVFGSRFLEDIVEFVGQNFDPHDVFDDEAIKNAVRAIQFISPEDVFSERELEDWAANCGYIHEG
jgi:hypothetical protein